MIRYSMIAVLTMWLSAAPVNAAGGNDWLAAFNESCARTTEAMDLSREDLLALIARCEQVKKAIDTQDEAVRKVYRKRVQMCLDLFQYVLDSRGKAGSSLPSGPSAVTK